MTVLSCMGAEPGSAVVVAALEPVREGGGGGGSVGLLHCSAHVLRRSGTVVPSALTEETGVLGVHLLYLLETNRGLLRLP